MKKVVAVALLTLSAFSLGSCCKVLEDGSTNNVRSKKEHGADKNVKSNKVQNYGGRAENKAAPVNGGKKELNGRKEGNSNHNKCFNDCGKCRS